MAKRQEISLLDKDKTYQKVRTELEKELHEKEFKERQKQLDERAQRIRNSARENLIKYGEHNPRTQFAIYMLSVTLAIREFMDQISIVSDSLRYISDVISILDDFIDLQENLTVDVTLNRYGFFRRIKIRLNARKVARGIKNKIKAAFEIMKVQEEIIRTIVESLSKVTKVFNMTDSGRKGKKRKQNIDNDLYNIAREMVKNDVDLPAVGISGDNASSGSGNIVPKGNGDIDISEL